MNPLWYEVDFWGNSLSQWGVAVGLALLVGLGLKILLALLVRRLASVSRRTASRADDLALELLRKTKGLFVALLAFWAGSLYLSLSPSVAGWFEKVVVVGFLLQGGFWVSSLAHYFLEEHRKRRVREDPSMATALGALGVVVRGSLWLIFVLLILQNLGIQITALVTGLGIGGIAVALAVQNVLGDLLASLSIVLDKPFVIGDLVVVGEFTGTVEHVGLKTTRIRSLSGEQVIFSNSDLLKSRIRNFKRMEERRVLFTIGVTYQTGYDSLRRIPVIVREVVEAQPNTRFDRCHFKAFGDFALLFETVYFVSMPEMVPFMDAQQGINLELYRRFQEEGIEFAYPTQTVFIERAE